MELHPGDRVDRYILIEQLGEGGQGAVWKAEDPLQPGEPRALKLVPVLPSRPNDAERVRREARALARLEHPSLVQCHGLFEDLRASVVGVVMDFVDGTSLRGAERDPRLRDQHRLAILRHVAGALAYLHSQGVIHRDLKLDNVLVRSAFFDSPEDPRNVRVVDLGIAAVKDAPGKLTALGTVVGTIAYLAPELLDPATFAADESGPAIDVFAFGVLGWQLLVGEHPTGLPSSATLVDYVRAYRDAATKPSWPPGAPPGEWGRLLIDCLKVKQSERIPSGAELATRADVAPSTGVVVRPRALAELGSAPTSVASPEAMRDVTAASAQASSAAAAAQTASIGPTPSPRPATLPPTPPEGSRGRGAAIGLLALLGVTVLGGVAYLRAGSSGDPVPPASVAPTPIASEPPPAAHAPEASTDAAADAAADADAAAVALPEGCDADAGSCDCCPSGTECGSDCAAPLPPDQGYLLRLAEMPQNGRLELADTHPNAEVCVKLADVATYTCTRVRELADGGAPSERLYVTSADLTRTGIDVVIRFEMQENIRPSLAGAEQVRLPSATRALLCKGVTVETEGHVPIREVRFFLDPESAQTPPPRKACP